MLLFTKPDLEDDDDWSDPLESEPPIERQFTLRETSVLTVVCRDAGGAEIVGTAVVDVLMKVPAAKRGKRASWQSIGRWPAPGEDPAPTSLPLKLDVGGDIVYAVRLSSITAEGATVVDVDVRPWRAG